MMLGPHLQTDKILMALAAKFVFKMAESMSFSILRFAVMALPRKVVADFSVKG